MKLLALLLFVSSASASNYLVCDKAVVEDYLDYFRVGNEVSPELVNTRSSVFYWDKTMIFESGDYEYARLVNVDTDFIAYFTPNEIYQDCKLVGTP